MKILILSKKFPYPLTEGEPIAISYLSRSLYEQGCEVSLLVMNTSKHYFDPAGLPEKENHYHEIFTEDVNNDINIKGALSSFVKGRSYILSRFDSKNFERKLIGVLKNKKYDVVQLETPYLAHYIPAIRKYSKAVVAMRAHNVEHEIWQRVAATSPNLFKKIYLKLENRSLRKFEIGQLKNYDVLVAITERDRDAFVEMGFNNKSVVAPVGIDLGAYLPDFNCFKNKKSIAFIGALDWMPNQFGVTWFLENVWPRLSKKMPELEFHIAGKNTPDWMRKKSSANIFVHGQVPGAKAFINEHPVFIAPLFSGSGIKIKVLEAMALSRLVVTTEVGTEGIPAVHGKHLLIANTPGEFYDSIVNAFSEKEKTVNMGKAARAFIGHNFDNKNIAKKVVEAYEENISEKILTRKK
ncbi:MAG TPA: glycosyltransferase [Bacteroidetes bacterium]|nr:glycosyltransferase [Bacteroidota bacterium]